MIISSGSNTPYAVLAQSKEYQLSIAVSVRPLFNHAVLAMRVRYALLDNTGELDNAILPKKFITMIDGKSTDTVRASFNMPTGIKVPNINKHFGEDTAAKVLQNSEGTLYEDQVLFSKADIRDDFIADFGKLIMDAAISLYPAPHYKKPPSPFLSNSEMNNYVKDMKDNTGDLPEIEVVPDTDGVVIKTKFGVDKTAT